MDNDQSQRRLDSERSRPWQIWLGSWIAVTWLAILIWVLTQPNREGDVTDLTEAGLPAMTGLAPITSSLEGQRSGRILNPDHTGMGGDRSDNGPSQPQVDSSAATLPFTDRDRSRTVRFNGREFGLDPNAPARLAVFQRNLAPGSSAVALLAFKRFPSEALRLAWENEGIVPLSYVPENGWISRVQARSDAEPRSSLVVFQPLDASLRLDPSLNRPEVQGPVPVYIHLVNDRPYGDLLSRLRARGYDSLVARSAGEYAYLAGQIPEPTWPALVELASHHPDVQFIERGRQARLLNDDARPISQSGSFLGPTPLSDHGVHGSNQVIAVCDTGLDIDSCFFRDDLGRLPPLNVDGATRVDRSLRKVVAVDFLYPGDDPVNPGHWDNHGHGTGVAGCAVGADVYAPLDPYASNGMAPGARLIVQDAGYVGTDACADLPGLGCPVSNFYPVLLQAVAQGASIHNNSWNDREDAIDQNRYSEACRELDLVTWSNKHFLVVCAAGNNGIQNSVGSPSVAKNALSVGASLSGSWPDRMAAFSSRGWAADGRVKPDVIAPGHGIRTAASDGDITTDNCYTAAWSGTSFAAPIVSGLAAQVRDYFAQGFYPTGLASSQDRRTNVTAALVKAVLINAATAMTEASAPPPAQDQGWGRVNLSQTLRFAGDESKLWVLEDAAPFAQAPALPQVIHLQIQSTNRPVKVTLVWTDYPTTPGADMDLVNDLDLRLRTPAMTLKGNVWSEGRSVEGGTFDRLNNVEQIHFWPSATGLVEISVWAHRIVRGPQDFALVVTGDVVEVDVDQDSDEDGLPDQWEQWHFGNLASRAEEDQDGDGVDNRQECLANTLPRDPQSMTRLAPPSFRNGKVVIPGRISEARLYQLEACLLDEVPGGWFPVGPAVPGGWPAGDLDYEFVDPTMHGTGRLYRLRVDLP